MRRPTASCSGCGSTRLRLVSEVFEPIAQIYIAEICCADCQRLMLSRRSPTQPQPTYLAKEGSPMKLFDIAKVGLYLDTITHGTEKRKGEEVKICTLVLRVQPFDVKLASTMTNGVRATLFNLNDAEQKPHLRRVEFDLKVPRQNLLVFASPDTAQASIAFSQAKISRTYARTEKAVNGYGFVFKASFGPLGRAELEYIQDWHLAQRFVSFEEAEPGMFDDEDDADDSDAEGDEDTPSRPAPMFADDRDENRPLISHQKKRRGKAAAAKGDGKAAAAGDTGA